MSDAEFNKNLTAAEYEAISIVQAQNPTFQKIEGEQLRLFYEWFEKIYRMKERRIEPGGNKRGYVVISDPLLDSIQNGRRSFEEYCNLRKSYEKSVHMLAVSFANILAGVQFGFKAINPDVEKYKKYFLEDSKKISSFVKTIHPNLKLKYVPKRILEIYHSDFKNVHHFTVQYAEELAR